MQNKKTRILIVNVNWLGDVLFSTALIREVKKNYPESFLACMIPGRCQGILKGNPYLDEIIIFDEKDTHKGWRKTLRFIRELRARRFDTAILLHRSFTRTLICWLAGIKERIGYYTRKRAFLLTRKITVPQGRMHRRDYYLNIIESAGLKINERGLDFFVSREDSDYVSGLLNKERVFTDDFLVALNPGGNWAPKRWPKEYFALLADRLIKDLNAKVVISGAKQDRGLAEDIASRMKARPIIAAGELNLKQLAALFKRADLVISGDSAPLHIAAALGVPIIGLFGPTSPEITGPFSDDCIILRKDTGCQIPCYQVGCLDNRCMKAVSVEDVLAAVKKLC